MKSMLMYVVVAIGGLFVVAELVRLTLGAFASAAQLIK